MIGYTRQQVGTRHLLLLRFGGITRVDEGGLLSRRGRTHFQKKKILAALRGPRALPTANGVRSHGCGRGLRGYTTKFQTATDDCWRLWTSKKSGSGKRSPLRVHGKPVYARIRANRGQWWPPVLHEDAGKKTGENRRNIPKLPANWRLDVFFSLS